ncbi:hypothetical protein Lgee_0950 [Legionella geestiana]|uniref:Uncharacterized protein n=1 Tax=Legionella geestiana TaxID=45065 RepID=A0A0W0TYE6_9GAMM|nr:Thivi_2564 family membrane protein [Legionella geestiana]KTD00686.1 hypothetical protein Lgee_0950 [Legionella geestiana]STX53611.1 Uncharacterised protein [Legionella geestiana]
MISLLNLLVVIIGLGILMGLIGRFLPIPAIVKSLINLVILGVIIIYILQFFGIISTMLPPLVLFHG